MLLIWKFRSSNDQFLGSPIRRYCESHAQDTAAGWVHTYLCGVSDPYQISCLSLFGYYGIFTIFKVSYWNNSRRSWEFNILYTSVGWLNTFLRKKQSKTEIFGFPSVPHLFSSTHQFHTNVPILFSPKNPSVPHQKPLGSTPQTLQFHTPLNSTPKTFQFHRSPQFHTKTPQFHTKDPSNPY